nr:uncharacterized protein LOC117834714 [Setaria viridis]
MKIGRQCGSRTAAARNCNGAGRASSSPSLPAPTNEIDTAKAKTEAFLTSVRLALQQPLASRLAVPPTTAPTPTPRRSGRLAKQTLNATVRPSKKGEVLAMKKLGIISREGEAEQVRNFDSVPGKRHHLIVSASTAATSSCCQEPWKVPT